MSLFSDFKDRIGGIFDRWRKPPSRQPQGPPPIPQTPPNNQPSNIYNSLLNLHNSVRVGLSQLSFNDRLNDAAYKHCDWMAVNGILTHNGADGQLSDRLARSGYGYVSAGENIALGQETPDEVFNSWMNSPGHKHNILSPDYNEIGIAMVEVHQNGMPRKYWCVVFGRRFNK